MQRSKGDNVEEMLGAIGEMEAKLGARTVFCPYTRRYFDNFPTADFLPNTLIHVPSKPIRTILEEFPFRGHLPPKNL